MGLKAIVKSLDDVDESYRNLYVQKGDSFVLDVAGIDDHPTVSGLKNTMIQERDARKQREKELRDMASKVDGLDLEKLKGLDPDTYEKMSAQLEEYKEIEKKREQKKLRDKENWEKLEQQLRDEADDRIAGIRKESLELVDSLKNKLEEVEKNKENEMGNMKSSLEKVLKDNEIVSSLAKEKGNIPVLKPHVEQFVRVQKNDSDEYSAIVVDEKGQIRVTATGEPMTIHEFVVEMKEKPEFQGDGIFEKDKQDGGSGSQGNRDDGSKSKNNPFSKEHFNLTKQAELKNEDPVEYEKLKKEAGEGK